MGVETLHPGFLGYPLKQHLYRVLGERLTIKGEEEVLDGKTKGLRSEVKQVTEEGFLGRGTKGNNPFLATFTHDLEVSAFDVYIR